MIKVLMIGPDRGVHGGISAVVNNLYEAGLDEKVDLTYIGTMEEGSKCKKLIVALIAYIRFCRLLKQADIVHVNLASDNSFRRKAIFLSKTYKCANYCRKPKTLIHQHGGEWNDFYVKSSPRKQKYIQNVLKKADRFLVLSPAYKIFFENVVGIRKAEVFPDTISIPKLPTKEYGKHKILFLGRICREKGIVELIEAVSRLRINNGFADVELFIGGVWEDKELMSLIEPYNEFIKYVGWVSGEEKKQLFESCDIFALPSYFEGQSVAILEAMSYGCATVATSVGGIPMMIDNGCNGILVEPKDSKQIEDALGLLLSNDDLCRKYGESAYNTVKTKFNIDNTVDSLFGMYQELMNE